jgi:hypothetical protein
MPVGQWCSFSVQNHDARRAAREAGFDRDVFSAKMLW